MAEPPRKKRSSKYRPEFVASVWRDELGQWQCRVKSVLDGTEKVVCDLGALPAALNALVIQEKPHAEA